jgi:ATP-dependent DNA ligase
MQSITHRDLAKLKLTPRPFSRAGWIFELKYDGFRVLATNDGSKVGLVSRKGTNLLPCFPEIGRQLQLLDEMEPIARGLRATGD